MKSIQDAQMELDEFIKQYPHLNEYQKEIDRILDNALPEKRIEILGDMITAKLITLKEKLDTIVSILNELSSHNN